MVLQAEASYLDRGTFAVRLLPKFKEGDDEAKIVRGLQRIDELDLLLLEKTREGASPLPPRCAWPTRTRVRPAACGLGRSQPWPLRCPARADAEVMKPVMTRLRISATPP